MTKDKPTSAVSKLALITKAHQNKPTMVRNVLNSYTILLIRGAWIPHLVGRHQLGSEVNEDYNQ